MLVKTLDYRIAWCTDIALSVRMRGVYLGEGGKLGRELAVERKIAEKFSENKQARKSHVVIDLK